MILDEDSASEVSQGTLNDVVHALVDSTNFVIVLCVLLVAIIIGLLGLYLVCCIMSLRGDLDLVTDEETGRPLNRAYFVNPFRKAKRRDSPPVLPAPAND